jgi:hypothetical protein
MTEKICRNDRPDVFGMRQIVCRMTQKNRKRHPSSDKICRVDAPARLLSYGVGVFASPRCDKRLPPRDKKVARRRQVLSLKGLKMAAKREKGSVKTGKSPKSRRTRLVTGFLIGKFKTGLLGGRLA